MSVCESYKRHPTKADDRKSVWHYFLQGGDSAKCNIATCGKVLKCVGGSTKGLHIHLASKHSINLLRKESVADSSVDNDVVGLNTAQPGGPAPKKVKITSYFLDKQERSLPAVLSRMTALDGLPFSIFCTSTDIREGLTARGFFDIPKSANTMRSLVMGYSDRVRQAMISEMTQHLQKGKKFSLTFDEWTSFANKRYMNINVHGGDSKFWSLGLVRVSGSMPATKCVELVEQKLIKHGLSLEKDIVCITTDGASVMSKVGKIISCHQQLCFAHGLQLGVLSVLYKNKTEPNVIQVQPTDNPLAVITSDSDDIVATSSGNHFQVENRPTDCELDMEVEEYDESDGLTFGTDDTLCLEVFPELDDNFGNLIHKVRKVVCLFKHSPTKNDDVLQKYVKAEHGKELSVILDCKTRWSSLFTMLERFQKLQSPIRKALIDLKSPIVFSDIEFTQIENVVRALETVKLTVDALCRRDANLLTAEAALKFMITKLRSLESSVSRDLAAALSIRISQRRTQLSGVLRYLHTANAVGEDDDDDDLFDMPTIAQIRKIIKLLAERLDNSSQVLQQEGDPCRHSAPTASTASDGSTSAGIVGDISANAKVTYKEPNISLIDLAMKMYFITLKLSRLA